jgi:hypothetical protein
MVELSAPSRGLAVDHDEMAATTHDLASTPPGLVREVPVHHHLGGFGDGEKDDAAGHVQIYTGDRLRAHARSRMSSTRWTLTLTAWEFSTIETRWSNRLRSL